MGFLTIVRLNVRVHYLPGSMQSALYPLSVSMPTVAYFQVAKFIKRISKLSSQRLKSCMQKQNVMKNCQNWVACQNFHQVKGTYLYSFKNPLKDQIVSRIQSNLINTNWFVQYVELSMEKRIAKFWIAMLKFPKEIKFQWLIM